MKLRENRFLVLIWNHASVDEFDALLRSHGPQQCGHLEQALALFVKLRGLSFDTTRETQLDQMADRLEGVLRRKETVAA